MCRYIFTQGYPPRPTVLIHLICIIYHMGHGQYLVYSSKSSLFEECIIVFQVLVYSKCYRFLKSVLSFAKPQLNFKKIETARILLSINLKFGCSSYNYPLSIIIISYYTIAVASKLEKPASEAVLHGSTGFLKTIPILTMIPFDPSARISPLRVAKEIPARRTQRGSMASTFNDLGRWTMVDRGLRKKKKMSF